ncbi:MAG: hypothetical protein ACK4GP_19815, partial [Deinococcus sp.]
MTSHLTTVVSAQYEAGLTRRSCRGRVRHTDSVCFADNPGLHRIVGSTSGTRFAPTRFARIEWAL